MLKLLSSPEPFIIRPYQTEAHRAIRASWADGLAGVMVVMATGTGKTATALSLIVRDFLAHGRRVVWLAHREELVVQPADTVARFWPAYADRVGIVQAERDSPRADLVCASVATLATSPHRVDAILAAGPIDLLVVDEAHHSTSPTQQAAIQALGARLRLGLTATPDREDGADLSEDWEIAFSYSIVDAIGDGYLLAPFAHVERLPRLDLSRVSGRWDYDDAELGAELLRAGVVEHTVQLLTRAQVEAVRLPERDLFANISPRGRAALVFTATVEQAQRTALALRDAGLRAVHISGKTAKAERRRMIRAFRAGHIDILCNAAVLTEGTDLPRASCVVLARPTRSWSLFVQMVGRGLRLHGDQADCLILDVAGATEGHSLISAPVLIGGSKCRRSPNGAHSFTPAASPQDGARCDHCNAKIACGVLMGPHKWGADHHCEACGRPQCAESQDGAHHWTSAADHKRRCVECGMEIPDPLAGLLRERRSDAIEADWVRIPDVAPECYAVDLGDYGILYVRRQRPGWMPVWLAKGGRKPRPLSSRPLRTDHVRAYADDLVKRAERVAARAASWKGGRPDAYLRGKARNMGAPVRPGETAGEVGRRLLKIHARNRAIKTKIVRPLGRELTYQDPRRI